MTTKKTFLSGAIAGMFLVLGLCARGELIAEHPCGIYIFELKIDKSADEGLKQIHERGYAEPYKSRGLPIYAFGLSFDSETRQFVDGKVEKLM